MELPDTRMFLVNLTLQIFVGRLGGTLTDSRMLSTLRAITMRTRGHKMQPGALAAAIDKRLVSTDLQERASDAHSVEGIGNRSARHISRIP